MDTSTQIILANATRAENWEDREKATGDVKTLMEEFDKRLPSGKTENSSSHEKGEEEPRKVTK